MASQIYLFIRSTYLDLAQKRTSLYMYLLPLYMSSSATK